MASSEVDIANLALSHLGDDATVAALDPPEGSAQAEHAARFYPIARDTLLEMHSWKFATARSRPALIADLSTPNDAGYGPWSYIYAEPANLLRVLAVLPTGYADEVSEARDFATETDADGQGLILTATPDAVLRYTLRITDPARFSPLFVESLGWLLASYLAGPIVKGDTGAAEGVRCYTAFLAMFARATGSSANQAKVRPTHTPEWVGARG